MKKEKVTADFPQNFSFNSLKQTLGWDSVEGAEGYEIDYKLSYDPQSDWLIAYTGINITCPFIQPPGTYNLRGKSKGGKFPDVYGPTETLIIG